MRRCKLTKNGEKLYKKIKIMNKLKFIKGRAIVKDGRKVIAKIYHRPTFYPLHNINSGYSQPYSIEMNIGQRECKDLEECIFFIKKYALTPLANY